MSVKSNFLSTNCQIIEQKAILEVVVLPEQNCGFRIYVAWENERAAKEGFMGYYKSDKLYPEVNMENIKDTMDYGVNIESNPRYRVLFKSLRSLDKYS